MSEFVLLLLVVFFFFFLPFSGQNLLQFAAILKEYCQKICKKTKEICEQIRQNQLHQFYLFGRGNFYTLGSYVLVSQLIQNVPLPMMRILFV